MGTTAQTAAIRTVVKLVRVLQELEWNSDDAVALLSFILTALNQTYLGNFLGLTSAIPVWKVPKVQEGR